MNSSKNNVSLPETSAAAPEEMLILAPAHELALPFKGWKVAGPNNFRCPGDTKFNEWIEAFLEEGVFFRFDENQQLPRDLPDSLAGFRCVVIDPARRAEFESGPNRESLQRFTAAGGHVVFPDLTESPPDLHVEACAVIRAAGLTRQHPALIRKLRAVDDQRLLAGWKSSLAEQARVLMEADAGWAWGDPVGYHYYWPVWEAARFYDDPSLLEPAWALIENGLNPQKWKGEVACNCGVRFALKHYERTGNRAVLDRLQRECAGLLRKVRVPRPGENDDRPAYVRKDRFVWLETAAHCGENVACFSAVTGDPVYRDEIARLVEYTHQRCFDPVSRLWLHHARPEGPDRELGAPWGRGNGWMLYGIRGLLEDMPAEHPARPGLCRMLAQGLDGLVRRQGPQGLWRNVLDATEEEQCRWESCTAWMFINVYARAYWKGWLKDDRIPDMCEKAWLGLKTRLWRGLPVGHCCGTGPMTRAEYLKRPHCKFLGTAPFLSRLELERMRVSL